MDKKLGLWACTALVIGNMIGTGIFLLPASLASYGGWSLLGWLFTTGGSLCLALVLAWLSSLLPKAGGMYAYTASAFGPFAGFMAAWGYWLCLVATNAAIAVGVVGPLAMLWPVLNDVPLLGASVALALNLLLTAINCRGVHTASSWQNVTTLLKLLPFAAIIFGGLFAIKPDLLFSAGSAHHGFEAVSGSATLTLWAFLGFESATFISAVANDPAKTIPRATIIGTLVTAVIYILSTTVVQGLVPAAVLGKSTAPFVDAASRLWGPTAALLIAGGAVISGFGALNGWILLGGQVPQAMAVDGMLPAAFGRLNRSGAPAFSLWLTAIVSSALILANYTRGLVGLYTFVILLATLGSLIPYVFCSLAYLVLRRGIALSRTHLVIAVLGFLYSMWAIYGAGQEVVYWGFLLWLSGIVIYVTMRRSQLSTNS